MGLFDFFARSQKREEQMFQDQANKSQLVKSKKQIQQGIKTPDGAFEANSGLVDQYKIYRADSILKQTVAMYTELCLNNGFAIFSADPKLNEKLKSRLNEIEFNSNQTMYEIIRNAMKHFIAFGNQMFVFARNEENVSGKSYVYDGRKLEPISGIFITHPITIAIQRNSFGEVIQYKQDLSLIERQYNFFVRDPELNFFINDLFNTATTRKFDKYELAHFKYDEDILTGFGRPFYFEAIDDLLILRKIERIIEHIIEKGKLMYSIYKVGNDKMPARSRDELINVKAMLESMEPYDTIVAPHNHEIETRANNVLQDILTFYAQIRHRVYGQLGLSSVMMGEAGQANRATAETSVNFAILKAKEFQRLFAQQFQHEVLEHIVIDLGYNPKTLGNAMPKLVFNNPDFDALVKQQNQAVYLYEHSAVTFSEMREMLNMNTKVNEEDMYIYHTKKPLIEWQAEAKNMLSSEPDKQNETQNKINPQNQHTKNS